MNTSFDIKIWIDATVAFWRDKGIELEAGISETEIKDAEQIFQFQFPPSFKELYRKVNGFKANDWNEHMISIWPIEKMLVEHSHNRYPNFVGFGDFMINSHFFGFLRIDLVFISSMICLKWKCLKRLQTHLSKQLT